MTSESCSSPYPVGLFINATLIEGCAQDRYTMTAFSFVEMNFKEDSTVILDNGTLKFTLPVLQAETPCQFMIRNPAVFGELYFYMTEDNVLHLLDTATTQLNTASIFEKRMDETGSPLSFDFCINDCVLTGEYLVYKDGVQQPGFITIMANGQLNGLKPYLGYELCYAGNCGQKSDMIAIHLFDQSGQRKTFAFKKKEGKKVIEMYAEGEATDDSGSGLFEGPVAFELRLK